MSPRLCACLAAALGIALLLAPALPAAAAQRDTVLFMSDLHMNLDGPYSWQRDHVSDVAAFLRGANGRSDVSELVIMGDLVDQWVFPMSQEPDNGFADILGEGINRPIVSALQGICANPEIKVSYVAGNHDLLSFTTANRDTLSSFFPGMTILSDDPGLGYWSWDDVVYAEHGHRYCLFNAPDTWSRDGGHLPLGYYISRAVAEKNASDPASDQYLDLLANSIASNGISNLLPDLVYDAVLAYTGHVPGDVVRMNGFDGVSTDPTASQVAALYADILSQWPDRQDIVGQATAVVDDMGTLVGAAAHQFSLPTQLPFTPRIMLFGHTHNAVFHSYDYPQEHLYLNTGTWIDGKPETWAEVKKSSASGTATYRASLWWYGEDTPRYQDTISVAVP